MNILDQLYEKARLNPQKVAFPEATNEKMMQAAYETGRDGYIHPVLVGDAQEIQTLAVQRGYDLSIFTIVDIHDEAYKAKVIDAYVNQPGRMLKAKALGRRMENPLYFAMAMQAVGDADVTFAGIDNTTGDVLLAGQMIIGMKPGISTISSIGLCDIPGYEGSEAACWQWATAPCAPTPTPSSWHPLPSPPAIPSMICWAGSPAAPWSATPPLAPVRASSLTR